MEHGPLASRHIIDLAHQIVAVRQMGGVAPEQVRSREAHIGRRSERRADRITARRPADAQGERRIQNASQRLAAAPSRKQRIESFVDFLANPDERSEAAAGGYSHE